MPLPEPQITRYLRWLHATQGRQFADYDALWRWSVNDLEAFWLSMWQFFDVQSPTPFARVLSSRRMPGARWFEGAQVNYARQVLRHADEAHAAGHPAIVFADEPMLAAGQPRSISWPQLREQVAAFAAALRRMGVQRGDRVCAYLPNRPETAIVVPGLREHRRDLVDLLARHGAGGGARPLPPDRAQGADRLRRLPLRRRRARPPRGGGRARRATAQRGACGVATAAGTAAPRRMARAHVTLHDLAALLAMPTRRRSSPSGCPSIIRCGWCTRAAPPACPSRSCTAMAASCSRA